MLCVYSPDCTDFSGNGLGTIAPSSALVKETLNGEYELEIIHPMLSTVFHMDSISEAVNI